jgi:hypothetical protein
MEALWPWMAVAAAGALHGIHPATGWALAAWRAADRRQMLRALLPIGIGHAASVVVVAAAVPAAMQIGVTFDPRVLQGLGAAMLLTLALRHVRGTHRTSGGRSGSAGLALWSFIVGTGHGAGWLLVPALVPLCGGTLPGRELTASGSLWLSLAAASVHMAAMLGTVALMAAGVRRGVRAARKWLPLR